jgi:hypothetical protein
VLAPDGSTALHEAASLGNAAAVSVLLAHPGINVNLRDSIDCTAFMCAFEHGSVEVAGLMAQDSRVDVNIPSRFFTPLWYSVHRGEVGLLRHLIASGKPLDVSTVGRQSGYGGTWTSALETARFTHPFHASTALLEGYINDPVETLRRVRAKLRFPCFSAANLFATVVFLCDGFLQGRRGQGGEPPLRFFAMAQRLPMELQMVLCHRVYGSTRDSIISRNSEVEFRKLARVFA